ncbi:trihelix transcription factor GTL1-like isoform X1 [Zingiber officinale]|uniref:trihelix transcription factor GTL1-like isoform X1 n=1 Tax=Zingiber officinale TaxID=94328 RepID=UPI001C4C35CF|nr:trihelix transcription factor GTL1-like isoform X1 [Zingiber officinale]
MQQQAQPQGGTQFGASPSQILPFSSAPVASRAHLLGIPPPDEVASPISVRPPPPAAPGNFDKLQVAVEFPDDEALAVAGDDPERGGSSAGNRWPRQETLALLKIRSEMDASFRDATLKAPLWEEVSRKLAELGYKRSAKKCKEKFENVHKYYKRTKEGRAGRQDGKSYRFFTQLEALHSGAGSSAGPSAVAAPAAQAEFADASSAAFSAAAMVGQPPSNRAQPVSSVAPPPPIVALPTRVVAPELAHGISTAAALTAGFSFSSNSSSSASSESDEETAGESQEGRKRKREATTTSRKMMDFFDGLMKQVMERQEAMHQRFLEAIEKREQDRMIREEAWRRQEMTRLNREQEMLAQERAIAASRDTAIISYLQKITGQNISLPTPGPIPPAAPGISTVPLQQPSLSQSTPPPPPSQNNVPQSTPPPAVPPQASQTQPPQIQQSPSQVADIDRRQSPLPTLELAPSSEPPASSLDAISPTSSSRWPKAEVHALIKVRSGLDSKYLDSGSKGPLWEEVSAGMQRLGYNRSAKRCKEKWENINKYYKKVKESNKKRPEDSKTCTYFHQLDALHRGKLLSAGGGSMQRPQGPDQSTNTIPPSSNQQQITDAITTNRLHEQEPVIPPLPKSAAEAERKNGNSDINAGVQIQTGNGGLTAGFFDQGLKQPEDIMKELMGQRQHPAAMDHDYDKLDDDSDNTDQDDEDEDDDNHEIKNNNKILHYKI